MSVLAIVFALMGVAVFCEANIPDHLHQEVSAPAGWLLFIGALVVAILIATGSIAR